METDELFNQMHPEKAEMEDALGDMQEQCSDSRQRIEVEARALRLAMNAWVEAAAQVARETGAVLEKVERWAQGQALPTEATDATRRMLGEDIENALDTSLPFAELAWDLTIEAAMVERPELVHQLDIAAGYTRHDLTEWRDRLSRMLAEQTDLGNGQSRVLLEAMIGAFMEALKAHTPMPMNSDAQGPETTKAEVRT